MRNPIVNIMLLIFIVVLLTCGLRNVSYGQDAVTFSNLTCEITDLLGEFTDITVSGTVRANEDVKGLKVWITINGRPIWPQGTPPADPFGEYSYLGGDLLGDLSEGETKSFTITETLLSAVSENASCGIYYERLVESEPGNNPDPEPDSDGNCSVGDVLSPRDSCNIPGTNAVFAVLADGSGNYREGGINLIAGTGISWNDFSAEKQGDGTWIITALPSEPEPASEPVSIPDANLEAAIRKSRDIAPDTPITQSDMLRLRTINAREKQIADLTGLQYATNLTEAILSRNQISDVSPLANLVKLTTLSLHSNQISDVSPLANLVNLETLRIYGNPIKNRRPLLALLQKNPDIEIYLKDDRTPLPVTLSHFRAEHTDTGVVLKWITESEVDNAGFYIYRSETKEGEFKVVNPTMLQGAGTTSERNEYTWTDTTAKPNTVYFYQIEDISHAGERKRLATVRLRGLVSAKEK